MIHSLLLGTAALVIATKALDCLTTLAAVPTAAAETNPIARRIMRRLGVRRAVVLVFTLSTAWTGGLTILAAATGTLGAVLFIATGLGVATVQAAVAHTNWTGRWNPITSRILRLHSRISSLGQLMHR